MKLVQKRLFRSREFEITDTGFKTSEKLFYREWENEVPFEDVDLTHRLKIREFYTPLLIATGILALLTFGAFITTVGSKPKVTIPFTIGIISALLTPLTFLLAKYFRRDEILFRWNEGYVGFFSYLPSKIETEEFLMELRTSWLEYLMKKYGNDADLPPEQQISNLRWLYDRGVISTESYESAKNSVKLGLPFTNNFNQE